MSEDSLRFLQSEVSRLQKENGDLRAEAKGYRLKYKEARTQIEAKQAELDALLAEAAEEFDAIDKEMADLKAERDEIAQKAEMSPGEHAERIKQLEAEIRNRDIKAKFGDVEKELADGLKIEDIFKLHGFDPAEVDPAEIKVDELVKGWRESKPGTFRAQTSPDTSPVGTTRPARPAPLSVGEGSSRGARDMASGTVSYTRDEIATPGWERRNPALATAINGGTAVLKQD